MTAFLLATFQFTMSQAITLDSGFNGTGKLVTDYHDSVNYLNFRLTNVSTLAIQADGKIVIGGARIDSQLIYRYNSNGSVDSSFGNNGIAAVYKSGSSANPLRIRILPNGKIMVLAWEGDIAKYCLYRYLPDGKPDKDYGLDGKTVFDLPSPGAGIGLMEIQADGKILLAGNTDQSAANWPGFYIMRLNPGGSPDNSFGHAGEVKTLFNAIKNDTLNGDFYYGGGGIVDLAIQKDGKIIACGTISSNWNGYIISDSIEIVRYNTDGSLDNSFSNDGKVSIDVPNVNNPYASGTCANSVSLQPDGKIVVGGGWYSNQTHGQWQVAAYTLVRLLPGGMPDSTFDDDGVMLFSLGGYDECVKTFIQSDGKILLLGNYAGAGPFVGNKPSMSLTRANMHGGPDNSFGPGAFWIPDLNDNSVNEMNWPAYNALIKGQRIYVIGYLPSQYDGVAWGNTIFAFKIDGIAANPKTLSVCATGTAATIVSDLPGNNYQWQVSTDSINFNNVNNDAHYGGAIGPVLSINNIPLTWNSYQYRCLTENSISNVTTLHFLADNENEWTGTVSNAWEDPGNWLCGTVPGNNSTVIISSGNIIIHSNVTIKNIQLQPGASLTVDTGYNLSVHTGKNL